jgi:hypothetical protein
VYQSSHLVPESSPVSQWFRQLGENASSELYGALTEFECEDIGCSRQM